MKWKTKQPSDVPHSEFEHVGSDLLDHGGAPMIYFESVCVFVKQGWQVYDTMSKTMD